MAERGATFDLTDGVGCESCHGEAGPWLSQHARYDTPLTDQIRQQLQMTNTKNLRVRAETCLQCHLGDQQKTVDHELIAAGHPDLVFEMETFSALMPRHWREDDKDFRGARRWAVGQAVALQKSMNQLARRIETRDSAWPEFSDLECSACHHELALPSTRQQRGYTARAGAPSWNEARYIVFRELLAATGNPAASGLNSQVEALKSHTAEGFRDKAAAAATTRAIESLSSQTVGQIEQMAIDGAMVRTLLGRITKNRHAIAQAGVRSAQQATMAIDTLSFSLLSSTGRKNDALNGAIDSLYKSVESMPRYNPDNFEELLKRVENLLP
jgi:hypothetical protein